MTPAEFPQANKVFAKDQPEYVPLPAFVPGDEVGTVVTCWQCTPEELAEIQRTGKVWLSVWTFNKPLSPLLLTASPPFHVIPG